MKNNNEKLLILFDGVCNLCNGVVDFIIKWDKYNRFIFTAIQSEEAELVRKKFDLKESDISSIILIKNNKAYHNSTAILNIIKELPSFWKILYIFITIPEPLRNYVYDIIANRRYRIFGKREFCRIPDESNKMKFL